MTTKFSKKHYEVIAEVLNTQNKRYKNPLFAKERTAMNIIAYNFIDIFQQDNSNFSYGMFIKAINKDV